MNGDLSNRSRDPELPKPLYSIAETCRVLGVGKTTIYALFNEGRLEKVKIGDRAFVKATSIQRFLESLDQ